MMRIEKNYHFDNHQTLRCGLQVRNAFVLAPLDLRLALFDGTVSRNDLWFHQQHTRTVGLDIVGSAYVSTCGQTVSGSLSVAEDTKIPGLRCLAARIHRQGSKAILQLSHAGQLAQVDARYWTAVGPSATTSAIALSREQVQQIVEEFGQAAQRAYQAGFDGVELQGANHFLLQQFMSKVTNHRSDEFGGTLGNRLMLPIRVVQRVQRVAQNATRPFAIGYRLSPEERCENGLKIMDTLVLARILETMKIDYLSLSLHQYRQVALTGDGITPVAQCFKRQLHHLPIMVAGNIRTAADLDKLVKMTDLVAMGTSLIFTPDWPAEKQGNAGDTRQIISAESMGVSPEILAKLIRTREL